MHAGVVAVHAGVVRAGAEGSRGVGRWSLWEKVWLKKVKFYWEKENDTFAMKFTKEYLQNYDLCLKFWRISILF